jgi:hypothetical protein
MLAHIQLAMSSPCPPYPSKVPTLSLHRHCRHTESQYEQCPILIVSVQVSVCVCHIRVLTFVHIPGMGLALAVPCLVTLLDWSKVQQICMAAQSDGLVHPDVVLLASLGSRGRYERNCHPELLRKLAIPELHAAVTSFDIPFNTQAGLKFYSQDMLLPHEAFAAVFAEYPTAFQGRILGRSGRLEQFWQDMETHPQMSSHPLRARADYRQKAIPLSLHGDGVPVAGVGKAFIHHLH